MFLRPFKRVDIKMMYGTLLRMALPFGIPPSVIIKGNKSKSLERSLNKRILASSPVSGLQHREKASQNAMKANLLQETKSARAQNEQKRK